LLDDDQRARLEREEKELEGGRLVLTTVVEEADRYWTGRLPGMEGEGEVKSWRGFYAIVYRNYSGFAHPTVRGLSKVVDDLDETRRRVRLESPYDGAGPYGIASVIFGLGLLVAAEALGWPNGSEIEQVVERFR
jgi:hypothetical protein